MKSKLVFLVVVLLCSIKSKGGGQELKREPFWRLHITSDEWDTKAEFLRHLTDRESAIEAFNGFRVEFDGLKDQIKKLDDAGAKEEVVSAEIIEFLRREIRAPILDQIWQFELTIQKPVKFFHRSDIKRELKLSGKQLEQMRLNAKSKLSEFHQARFQHIEKRIEQILAPLSPEEMKKLCSFVGIEKKWLFRLFSTHSRPFAPLDDQVVENLNKQSEFVFDSDDRFPKRMTRDRLIRLANLNRDSPWLLFYRTELLIAESHTAPYWESKGIRKSLKLSDTQKSMWKEGVMNGDDFLPLIRSFNSEQRLDCRDLLLSQCGPLNMLRFDPLAEHLVLSKKTLEDLKTAFEKEYLTVYEFDVKWRGLIFEEYLGGLDKDQVERLEKRLQTSLKRLIEVYSQKDFIATKFIAEEYGCSQDQLHKQWITYLLKQFEKEN